MVDQITYQMKRWEKFSVVISIRDYPFSTTQNFKQHTCAHQGVRNASFLGYFA